MLGPQLLENVAKETLACQVLHSNDFQYKLILSGGKESYYEQFSKTSYSSPHDTWN